MDHGSFDKLARLLGAAGSRRAALGTLLGAGALGVSEATAAKKKKKRRKGKQGYRGGVSAQAVCAPPSNGVNRNNCTYDNDDYSGQLIHSSSYKNTTWVDATLIETDLHSSNFKGGSFRRANLCKAKLHSSTLTGVNFNGANLTLADLHSSACGGADFTASTFWCETIDCNGTLRNDDCPGGLPSDLCCEECAVGEECIDNECVNVCDAPFVPLSCHCLSKQDGSGAVCINTATAPGSVCTSDASCTGGTICVFSPCPSAANLCLQPCPFPIDCVCAEGAAVCEEEDFINCGQDTASLRRNAAGSELEPLRP